MAKTLYCWRCKAEVPMLDEHEWEQVLSILRSGWLEILNYRKTHNATLQEAEDRAQLNHVRALERYFQLTRYRETRMDALWHHRLCRFGPPCRACGKPLRTPRATFCAACGTAVDG
jgi:hypothetical protein